MTNQLSIISAYYGANNTWIEVTNIINSKILNNTLHIIVNNVLVGDPIFGVLKNLQLHYKIDDETHELLINENNILSINTVNNTKLNHKCAIIYTYYKSKSSDYNLSFFIKQELIKNNNKNCDYFIVINGYDCDLIFPSLDNVTILKRPNNGFDFGGHNYALEYINKNAIDTIDKIYDYYFFMNSGVIGPIIKNYDIIKDLHWSNIFINKITDKVKLVSTTIVCPTKASGEYGPKVEGFFFMTDNEGLAILKKESTIFCNHFSKFNAITDGEFGLSRCIIKNKYTIDCILSKYQNIDWLDKKTWNMNNNEFPSRKNSFYGNSIDPYEVIFHKWYWHGKNTVNFDIVDNYIKSIK